MSLYLQNFTKRTGTVINFCFGVPSGLC